MCMYLSDHLLRLDFVGRMQDGEGGQWKSEWGEESGEGPRVREGRGSEAIPSCIFLGLAPLRKRVMEYQGVLDDSDSEKEGMVRILLS